jgi:hypothetical protein
MASNRRAMAGNHRAAKPGAPTDPIRQWMSDLGVAWNGRLISEFEVNDEDWARAWHRVRCELSSSNLHEKVHEKEIRRLVDQAALDSGYFGREARGSETEKHKKLLSKLEELAKQEELEDIKDRGAGVSRVHIAFLEKLDELRSWLGREINISAGRLTLAPARPAPPSASKLERDWWMARLVTIWRDECGLDPNSKQLAGFVLAATQTCGGSEFTSGSVKQFLGRWRRGEIPEPGWKFLPGWGC